MKQIINIGIAEDHSILREGIVLQFKKYRDINVIFSVSNGKELFKELKNETPDIILLDIEMPLMKGEEIMTQLKSKYNDVRIIILSAFFLDSYIVKYMRWGAVAFLPKSYDIDKIAEVIRLVHNEGHYYGKEVSRILKNRKKSFTHTEQLSEREIEVAKLVCAAKSTIEISGLLNVSRYTIDFHRKNISKKTNTKTGAALMTYCIEHKIINMPS